MRAPRKSAKNPEGCDTCWQIYAAIAQAARDEVTKPKPRKHSVATVKAAITNLPGKKDLVPGRMKVKVDELTGELHILYGTRSLYTALNESEVHAYVAGLREGLHFDGLSGT